MDEGVPPSRLSALVILGIGIGFAVWQWSSLKSEGKFNPKLLAAAVLFIPVGLAGLVEPKIINPWHSQYAATPGMAQFKIATAVAGAVLVVVALYFALALQNGWWLPAFLLQALAKG